MRSNSNVLNRTKKTWIDKCMLLLVIGYYVSLYILANVTWGRFIFLGVALLMLLLQVVKNRGKLIIRYKSLYGCFFVFAAYTFITSLWAWTPSLAIQKAETLCELIIVTMIISNAMDGSIEFDDAMNILLWGGIIVAIYSLKFYGIDGILSVMAAAGRLDSEFNNVNSLGLCWMLAVVIAFHRLMYKKKYWMIPYIMGLVVLVAATASRKALIGMLVGVVLILFARYRGKTWIATVLQYSILLIVIILAFSFLADLPVFSGVRARMDGFTDFFIGKGGIDNQAESRYRYIQIGIEQWKKTPIFGIGMANSYTLLASSGERETYLHNNFVELLACGGLVGFVIFYMRYFILLVPGLKSIKKDRNDEKAWLLLVVICMMVLMDYGSVSYTTKVHHLQMVILSLFLNDRREESNDSYNTMQH